MKLSEKIKSVKWGYLLFAVLLGALGIIFLSCAKSLDYLALAIGILLIVFAVFYAVLSLADKNRQVAFFLRLVFAVLALVAGVVTVVTRDGAIGVIVTVLGLLLIIDGSFKLQTAILSKRTALVGWWFMVALAALTVVGAFVTLKFDSDLGGALTVILGITVLLDALGNFLSMFYIAGVEGKMEEEMREKIAAEQTEEKTSRKEKRKARKEKKQEGEPNTDETLS